MGGWAGICFSIFFCLLFVCFNLHRNILDNYRGVNIGYFTVLNEISQSDRYKYYFFMRISKGITTPYFLSLIVVFKSP